MTGREKTRLTVFLLVETLLYGIVIFPGFYGRVNHPLRYSCILICAVFSLLIFLEKRDRNRLWLSISLLLTALADFLFEILPGKEPEAIFVFVLVQWCHGVRLAFCLPGQRKDDNLFRQGKRGRRGAFFAAVRIFGPFLMAAILLEILLPGTEYSLRMTRTEKLVLAFMLVYGLNILLNQAASFYSWVRTGSHFSFILSLAFFLFILCDITVAANLLYPYTGLSAGITEGMARLTWFFYIPSQIIFAVSGIIYDYSGK